ncbi:MAG: fructose 1,6-bisphosphatase, partial [Deltaproteobacteria bacterium]|nr:fructose 1,6-bisphosphatase [Deltaproteobacteria bacterium]
IKADIGSIGGHIKPSEELLKKVEEVVTTEGKGTLIDSYVGHTGDDIGILMTHTEGENSEK